MSAFLNARRTGRVSAAPCLLAALTLLLAAPCLAYTPGSGGLYSDDFETLDPDWEQSNGVLGNPSPWTLEPDGGDKSFYADGNGPIFPPSTRHWARHFVHPVTATSFSIAFEFRTERGSGYHFYLDLQQRAETLKKYRLKVDENGAVTLWRTESGVLTQVASTMDNTIPKNKQRWIRLAIEPDGSGHPRVRIRVWNGGATSEPGTWDIDFLDDLDTLARVHRFELEADGPQGVETFIDDLDAWGDQGNGVASSIVEIWVAELSHLDIGFTEPPDDIEAFSKTHLDNVLNNLAADPDYRWFIESGWFLDRWWERSTPAEHQNMINWLQTDRLMLSASYGMMHTSTMGHEEFARNVYYSSRMARTHGFPLRTFITDDVPGSNYAMPEVLARAGIDYFIGGMNTGFGGQVSEPDHGDRPFWWVGPDGSKVLAWHTFNSYAEGFQYGFSFFDNLAAMYTKLGAKLPEQEEAGYDYPELMLLRGFDNHYQGFHVRNLINQWNATYLTPQFRMATPSEFLDMMRAKYGDAAFPSYSGDYGAAWAGSKSGAVHTQRMVRQAHRDGRAAEALIAVGVTADAQPVPRNDIDFMYRKMLESDEHTGAGGWPGYFTPEEMHRNNVIHLGYAQDAHDTAQMLLTEGIDRASAEISASGDAVVAFNALGRPRDGWARIALPAAIYGTDFRVVDRTASTEIVYQKFDATSEIVFHATGLPAFGYRVYDLVPGVPTAVPGGTLNVTSTSLENDFYNITLDATDGSVVSIVELATGRELVDGASAYDFNELAANVKQEYDLQALPVAQPPATASAVVDTTGPLVAAVKVTRTGTPHVETTYRLYRNEDRFEIENVLDRDEMPYVPQSVGARAYMVTMPFDVHGFEIRAETTTKFLDPVGDAFLRTSLFDWHNVEHALAFWDQNGGVHYALDSVYAHHFENLSSLTSNVYSTGDALLLSRLKDKADEYEFDGGTVGSFEVEPGTSPIFRYTHHVQASGSTFDPVAASRFGFAALSPPETKLIARRPGNLPADGASFFNVDEAGVLPYTLKPAEIGSGVVLRLQELTGASTTAKVDSDVFTLTNPELVELDEEGGSPLTPDGSGFLVPLGAYETLTVRVDATPSWSPITLTVDKNAGAGTVSLSWTGGVTPFTVERAEDAQFTVNPVVVVDEQALNGFDDPVLNDGNTYFYLAK
jgi:hypothetical protein